MLNLTGTIYEPKEFRKYVQCLHCGRACNPICLVQGKCERCFIIDLKDCEICGVLLREDYHPFYSYDIREGHRNLDIEFTAISEPVREFVSIEKGKYPKHSKTRCIGCKNFEKGIKNKCYWCKSKFKNSEDNYKLNGNMCDGCIKIYPN